MYGVTNPALVIAALRAGIVGAIPRANAPDFETFGRWLEEIEHAASYLAGSPPWAVNLSTRLAPDEMERNLALCVQHGVEIIISATGDPTELVRRARGHGLQVYCDAINLRFARKAIAAGASGIIAIGAGGGGHSGTINHLTLVETLRREFDGVIALAGAVTSGAAIRAAEVLGADLAYMGTRFIATCESAAPEAYKRMLVSCGVDDLVYTDNVNGVGANWLAPSLRKQGLDPKGLPPRSGGPHGHAHLPAHVKPWENIWSAGQGVEHIDSVPRVGELVARLASEYAAAASIPSRYMRACWSAWDSSSPSPALPPGCPD